MILKKINTKYTKELLIFNKFSLFKKEKYISSSFYSVFNKVVYKTRNLVGETRKYFCGIRFYKRKNNNLLDLKQFANNSEYIYISYHTGELFYLLNCIKDNWDKYKNVKILTSFEYLKQIFYLFDFPEDWIESHFIKVPIFIPSCLIYFNKEGIPINIIETDYEKGFLLNKKYTNLHITNIIKKVFGYQNNNVHCIFKNKKLDSQGKKALIFPESIFNGNLSNEFISKLIKTLSANNYQIFINSKTNTYDNLLNEDVKKVFLPYKQTLELVQECNIIFGVRSGFFDCVHHLANNDCRMFIFYNSWNYPSYNRMKDFNYFCKEGYGISRINNSSFIYEYYWLKQNDETLHIINGDMNL